MKPTILAVILSVICSTSYAQNDDIEYMEVRIIAYQGMNFRLSPMTSFKKVGFFSKNLKPYFKQDEAALKAFKSHQLNMGLMYGSTLILSSGMSIGMLGLLVEDRDWIIGGGSATLVGIVLVSYFQNKYMRKLLDAIDFYNISKNPNLSQIQPFIPQLQPSSQSVGIGLVWDFNQ